MCVYVVADTHSKHASKDVCVCMCMFVLLCVMAGASLAVPLAREARPNISSSPVTQHVLVSYAVLGDCMMSRDLAAMHHAGCECC